MAETVSFRESPRVEWKVRNLFSVENLYSGAFNLSGSQWRLKLVKFGTGLTEGFGMNLFRISKFPEDTVTPFRTQVHIEDGNGQPLFPIENREWRSFYFIWECHKAALRHKEAFFSNNGVVTFVCILVPETACEDRSVKEVKPVQSYIHTKSTDCMEQLATDFRRLLDDGSQSDVTLKCREHTVPAHRLILSARSDVFAAMLRNDMAESRSGVIEISDMDPPILDQLLQFIYSSKLSDLTVDTAPHLYVAGDKYAMESLKSLCSTFLKKNLTQVSACSILLLADVHNDTDLKESVIAFILNTTLFHKDEVWPKFCEDHPKLANEVLNRACKTLFP